MYAGMRVMPQKEGEENKETMMPMMMMVGEDGWWGKIPRKPWQSDEEPQNHVMNGETHETRRRSPMETSATIYWRNIYATY